jgi:hypothetical protein
MERGREGKDYFIRRTGQVGQLVDTRHISRTPQLEARSVVARTLKIE